MRTAAIHSGARRIYGILGTAIVVRTRGGTPVRVGVFVDVCVGVEDAHAVKPLECRGPTQYVKIGSRAVKRYYIFICLSHDLGPLRVQFVADSLGLLP